MTYELTCGANSATYFDYTPENYEPVHTQRSFVVYAGDTKFESFESALADAERIGLKRLIDKRGFDLIILNPFTRAWETEGDSEANTMWGKLTEILKAKGEGYVWYWQRDLISFVGDRRGADYISEYCAAAYPATTISETFFLKIMAQSVTLLSPTKAPCSSGKYLPEAEDKLLSAFIVNGSDETIESYKKVNRITGGCTEKLGCEVYKSATESAVVAFSSDENSAIENAYELVISTFRRRNLGAEPLASVPRPNLEQIGVTKVDHCEFLDPENPDVEYKWYEYIPNDLEAGKKVPFVLVLHGMGENGQYIMEMSRWAFLAKSEGLICAAMTNHSVEKDSVLLSHLLKTLPIDPERCYATGFSMGGMSSSGVGLVDARFAAVAPQNGLVFGVHSYTDNTMPIIYTSGINDAAFPLVTRPEPETPPAAPVVMGNHAGRGANGPPPPSDAQQAVAQNGWRFNVPLATLNFAAEVLNAYYTKNGVALRYWSPLQFENPKNKFAAELENIFETDKVVGGHKFTIGDLPSKSGEVYTRLVIIDGLGHDVHPNTAGFIWDFIKNFKRGADGKTYKV